LGRPGPPAAPAPRRLPVRVIGPPSPRAAARP